MNKWESIIDGPFKPTWESLRTFKTPEWFKNAKFGIWSHWGPQAVPMYGDWYARNMYIEGSPQYLHHWRKYGHPSQHGWKDVVKLWKAEKFDPEDLMDKYTAAGAKYFVAQAAHHDNFDNWNSTHNKWNSVKMGPEKDIVGLWQKAAQKRGLPFGVTEHLGATFSWWAHNKNHDVNGPYAGVPYDGNDPSYKDLYLANGDEPILAQQGDNWYTANEGWHRHWFDRVKDLIDQYKPDLLYSDGPVPFEKYGLGIIAHLYNTSAAGNGGINSAVYNQKDKNPLVFKVGVLDFERNVQADAFPWPWQTDTCVGGWFYDVRQKYKSPRQVIEMLVDIVAKNGNLLLNLTQKPDGTLDDECGYILDELAAWIKVNGEGIYDTRPWDIALEGDTNAEQERFKEVELGWTPADFRFTQKDNFIYAFQMGWPENGKSLIKSFSAGRGEGLKAADVRKVELLGYEGNVSFEYRKEGLVIDGLPKEVPVKWANCLKITTGS
ncbi:MAG: alpha-L-fucosidase [Spirochaetales bacterium]|jgi:alpha-L-fucosidase|nr:alpha-L-fucosidase [Spirochaetales bacterium]